MSTKVPVVWHEEKAAKLRRWRVSVGEAVDEDVELAEIEPLSIKLKCTQKGTIRELLVPNGSALSSGYVRKSKLFSKKLEQIFK
jgi:pyruvate/2-oxoglutarate dehydrogenase complex dihydrolipoamide acyltransferase (E2) component